MEDIKLVKIHLDIHVNKKGDWDKRVKESPRAELNHSKGGVSG